MSPKQGISDVTGAAIKRKKKKSNIFLYLNCPNLLMFLFSINLKIVLGNLVSFINYTKETEFVYSDLH